VYDLGLPLMNVALHTHSTKQVARSLLAAQ
jgi:hypothetical protein